MNIFLIWLIACVESYFCCDCSTRPYSTHMVHYIIWFHKVICWCQSSCLPANHFVSCS